MLNMKKVLISVAVSCALWHLTSCGPEGPDWMVRIEDPPAIQERLDFDNIVPGRGYDLVTDSASDYCLKPSEASPIDGTEGQEVVFGLQLIEDSKTLAKQMEVSAAASIKWGFAGGEAKTKFVEQTEMSQTSVYALATVRVRNAPRVVRETALREDALRTLAHNPGRFRDRCGDGFISSIRTGGEFFGVIEISTSSEREKQELSASIKAGGMFWSAEASFSRAVNSTVANKSVKIHTIQSGGLGNEDAPCMDVACLLERARAIPDIVHRHPVLISASVLPYRKLALPDDAGRPIDTQIMLEVEADLVTARMDLRDLRSRYRYALLHPRQFAAARKGELEQAIRKCEEGINTINKHALACYRDIELCEMPALTYPDTQVPARRGPCDVVVDMCEAGRYDGIEHWQIMCQDSGGNPIDLSTCR